MKLILMSIPAIIFAGMIKVEPVKNNLDLTVYNNGYGMISENRKVIVPVGKSSLVYDGVPSSIIMESVAPSFSKPITLYSQNYGYDVFSLESLLSKTIGKEISYLENNIWEKGTLLAIHPILVKKEDGSIISLESANKLKFTSIPEDMATKPSLFWNIESKEVLSIDINLKYLTNGIFWNSDYVLNLNNKEFDLQGWITIKNNSGVSYENTRINCVAGEVNKISRDKPIMYAKAMMMDSAEGFAVPEESFGGYQLYKIPFTETIKDKEQKQISFIKTSGASFKNYGYENINEMVYKYQKKELKFDNIIEFENTKTNKLGISIPAGNVRVYKDDNSGMSRFIGEQRISNISDGETIILKVGSLFDVKGFQEIVTYTDNKDNIDMKSNVMIENNGVDDQTIILHRQIHVNEVFDDSCSGVCSKKVNNDSYVDYTIKLKGKEKYKLFLSTIINKREKIILR